MEFELSMTYFVELARMSILYSDVIDSSAIDTHSPSLVFIWDKKHENYMTQSKS